MQNKIDITSSALEKGIDLLRDFVGKFVTPAIEETGLLVKDQVTQWRFKNQLTILSKAKLLCEKNEIPLKTISLKLLCPLLDYSALEEEEVLQGKWAALLANMVDSRKNVKNHVFPYILSQISKTEFQFIEDAQKRMKLRVAQATAELAEHRQTIAQTKLQLGIKIVETKALLLDARKRNVLDDEVGPLNHKIRQHKEAISSLAHKESLLLRQCSLPETLSNQAMEEFEYSNLTRLGLIKERHKTFANSQTLEIPSDPTRDYVFVDLDIDVESETKLVLTDLAILFIQACTVTSEQS